jgi:hypothetical protein
VAWGELVTFDALVGGGTAAGMIGGRVFQSAAFTFAACAI